MDFSFSLVGYCPFLTKLVQVLHRELLPQWLFYFFFKNDYFICVGILPAYICGPRVFRACGGQKRESDPVMIDCSVGAGNNLGLMEE